ncbi:Ras family protein [Trichomonas vaginalis G3]|uniref:Ras family protein n=1 Tax=Trichomonas vaginalis (strain ATCC PRA-98 / G3) TaxID=412133 RepID=A2DC35_TRIV3|nr:GTPase protein [Trichomonas vaginalis G3]EAY22076.1 Ras family protein [Trichomonas vaginalis G3]KAI5525295.1 GTPase protein [Trichomonas vaginalis G3]|eukprot:XP_001583062.1 Ras family protein [Trichomonas vaginalis G3]
MTFEDPFDIENSADMEFKVVLVGDGYVGKTSIINRFYSDHFSTNEPPTIAASFLPIAMNKNGKRVVLNIWDTAGHEKFHCLVPLYARAANTLIVVFDLTNEMTFENAKEWYTKTILDVGQIPVCILCGNKLDLMPDANTTKYEDWAKAHNCLFITTSAANGTNVQEMFKTITEKLTAIEMEKQAKIKITVEPEQKKACAC